MDGGYLDERSIIPPSTPVRISGFKGVPRGGCDIIQVPSLQACHTIVKNRERLENENENKDMSEFELTEEQENMLIPASSVIFSWGASPPPPPPPKVFKKLSKEIMQKTFLCKN
jgi:hypothetical protein